MLCNYWETLRGKASKSLCFRLRSGVISRVNKSCDIWAALLSGSAQLALGIEGHQEQEVRCIESDSPSLLCCLWLLLGLELIFFKSVPTSSSLMSQDTTLWSQVSKVQVPTWDAIVHTLCLATSYLALRSQHRHISSQSPVITLYDLGPTRMTGPREAEQKGSGVQTRSVRSTLQS